MIVYVFIVFYILRGQISFAAPALIYTEQSRQTEQVRRVSKTSL